MNHTAHHTSTRTLTEPRAARVKRLSRTAVAALALIAALLGLAPMTAASASSSNRVVSCSAYTGFFGRYVMLDLDSAPVGTTAAIYLYKQVWNGKQNVSIYQNQMDWSVSRGAGYWQQPGNILVPRLAVYPQAAGFYYVQIAYWNAAGTYLGSSWSVNGCNYTS